MKHQSIDRGARRFVWAVWLVMLIIALICLISYGRNIPLAEDWLLVAPLTDHEPNLVRWLWSQNNEHRIPLPRLILLGLLKLTNGDFRSGMLFNILLLSLIAAISIQVARSLRGGRNSYADAFFPIALLNIGHWPNLFWSWQLTFVLPTALTYIILWLLLLDPRLTNLRSAWIAGISLILLPLCGANGLLFVPFLSLWLIYCGVLHYKSVKVEQQWLSVFLIASVAIALGLVGIYFYGYQRPTWNPPSPGLGATLETAAKFLAYSFGPVAAWSWRLFIIAALIVVVPSVGIVFREALRTRGYERSRAMGILLFCSILALFALAIGYGRAGLIPTQGFPIRYVIFAVPALCTAFFIWELYGSPKWQRIFQWGLCLAMCFLLPLNMIAGFVMMGNWYDSVMDAVERDIAVGVPISILAERHRDSLIHWWEKPKLAENIEMLYEDRIGSFAQIKVK